MYRRASLVGCLFLFVMLLVPSAARADAVSDDPSWWESTFFGEDLNGDGKIEGSERGILVIFWDWLKYITSYIALEVLTFVFEYIPEGWQVSLAQFAPYILAINAWVPLDFGMSLALYYYIFLAVFVSVKLVLKLIPTIG